MSWSELLRRAAWVTLAAMLSACAAAAASPTPAAAGVCALRAGASPSQIDVFDGDPAEQAILAPDDDGPGANTYTVGGVYAQGRSVTIRCHYGREAVDVKLTKPVSACRYSGDDRAAQIACK
ncbi:MAG: STY0301 family protein [Betaproteobacteria bacterium]